MVRPSQLLHAQREAAPALSAATVLLLRDTPDGLEVLITRRADTASFAPGAYVFPGGGIDACDAACHAQSTRRPTQSALHLTQAIAAIRESFEEVGILLARHADGRHATARDIADMDRLAPLADQCAARGLTLAGADVRILAHWTTARDLPRRYAVPFLVARMPEDQEPVADDHEQFEPEWVRPADALARHAAGRFKMLLPTVRTLARLQAYADVDAVLAACGSEQPLWTSCPRGGLAGGKETRYTEQDPPFGELELVSPDGQVVHTLDWQSERPVPLLKNLQRLTAPNPGAMTGPGTNSYLVGDPATGYIAIDPGPDDASHVQRLWAAARDAQGAGGHIHMIVCTHSHPDHSPGARLLQALCVAHPPILGLPSAPTARADSVFAPDRALPDGELLTLTDGTITHTLQVIHTPGHAANHLCLLLREDGLLLSGDHILNGSTTVVGPPDGDMTDYLVSLDRLAALCAEHAVQFIAPAHGYVLGDALGAIARLKQHRLQREAKVIAAMRARPGGTLSQWVELAYDDVPAHLWPVAKRSLLAHVKRVRAMEPATR